MKWVKASEKLPVHRGHWNTKKYSPHDNEFPARMNGRYFMANIFDNRIGGDVDPIFVISMNRHEYGKEYFDQIEWLDESEEPNQDMIWDEIMERLRWYASFDDASDLIKKWQSQYTISRK